MARKKKEPNPIEILKKPQPSPLTVEIPEGDNSKYTTFALAIMKMDKININDPAQLRYRMEEYFALCSRMDMKPAVNGLALAFGIDRRRLWEINTDHPDAYINMPQECKAIIKEAYQSLQLLWENYMLNGKINPVTGIFLGKNHFNYQDKQEYVLTPNTTTEANPDVIVAKYDELPE